MIYIIQAYERAWPQDSWIVGYSESKQRAKEAVFSLNSMSKRNFYWFEEVEKYPEEH